MLRRSPQRAKTTPEWYGFRLTGDRLDRWLDWTWHRGPGAEARWKPEPVLITHLFIPHAFKPVSKRVTDLRLLAHGVSVPEVKTLRALRPRIREGKEHVSRNISPLVVGRRAPAAARLSSVGHQRRHGAQDGSSHFAPASGDGAVWDGADALRSERAHARNTPRRNAGGHYKCDYRRSQVSALNSGPGLCRGVGRAAVMPGAAARLT
jgi:hypothetical protein